MITRQDTMSTSKLRIALTIIGGEELLKLTDIYWLAGIIEGEGYFGIRHTKYPYIQVRMTDLDVIERVNEFFKAKIWTSPPTDVDYKTSYCVRSSHKTSVALIMTIYILLGTRRKKQAKCVLNMWRNSKSLLRPGNNRYWQKNKHKYLR
jgi:hypothetical protein